MTAIRTMTVSEWLDRTAQDMTDRVEDEVRWARRQALQEAFAAVGNVQGNSGYAALDAQEAIQRLLDAEAER